MVTFEEKSIVILELDTLKLALGPILYSSSDI